jgi:hypothetical protein
MKVLSIDPGTKNLALCLVDFGADHSISKWWVTTIDGAGPRGLIATMKRLGLDVADIEEVVIEKQPPRNTKMLILQTALEMYFALRELPVHIQDARAKLNWAATTPWWPASIPENWTYAARKKISTQTARAWLDARGDDDSKNTFAASTKKDDLADSFLQACAYWHHVRPMHAVVRNKPPAKIHARKPVPKALESGKYTASGLKWVLLQKLGPMDATPEAVEGAIKTCAKLKRALLKLYPGGAEDAVRNLF